MEQGFHPLKDKPNEGFYHTHSGTPEDWAALHPDRSNRFTIEGVIYQIDSIRWEQQIDGEHKEKSNFGWNRGVKIIKVGDA